MEKRYSVQKSMKMDWLRLENRLRQCLETANGQQADKKTVYDFALILQEMSDIIGEETGRGYIMAEDWHKKYENLQN